MPLVRASSPSTTGELESVTDPAEILATGVSTSIGRTVVTNGFVVPLRTGENRGFDFEYNCQVQRTF